MKKWIIIGISVVVLAALAVAGFVWAGTAYAQAQNPPFPGYPYGMMGGRYGGFGMMGAGNYGPMHEYMVAALAEGLNLTPEEIQTRLANGETPWQIAQAQGLSEEQIQQLMLEAHDRALDDAVEAGVLTQEQADWMDQHMEGMWSGDFGGFGGCHGANGAGSTSSSTRFSPMRRGSSGPSF